MCAAGSLQNVAYAGVQAVPAGHTVAQVSCSGRDSSFTCLSDGRRSPMQLLAPCPEPDAVIVRNAIHASNEAWMVLLSCQRLRHADSDIASGCCVLSDMCHAVMCDLPVRPACCVWWRFQLTAACRKCRHSWVRCLHLPSSFLSSSAPWWTPGEPACLHSLPHLACYSSGSDICMRSVAYTVVMPGPAAFCSACSRSKLD